MPPCVPPHAAPPPLPCLALSLTPPRRPSAGAVYVCSAANLGGPAVSVLSPPAASGDYTWTAAVPGAFYAFCPVGTHCTNVSVGVSYRYGPPQCPVPSTLLRLLHSQQSLRKRKYLQECETASVGHLPDLRITGSADLAHHSSSSPPGCLLIDLADAGGMQLLVTVSNSHLLRMCLMPAAGRAGRKFICTKLGIIVVTDSNSLHTPALLSHRAA